MVAFFLMLFLFGMEDFLCLLILAAPFFLLATLGALTYRIIQINSGRKNNGKLLSIMLLPFLFGPFEEYVKSPSEAYYVTSEVIISAMPETIWGNIVEVKSIQPDEYHAGFFNFAGIPKPLSATVDKKAMGGKRIGNFEGGLRFIETITEYQPNQIVAFDIKIDPATVRHKVFDQHVLNGNYFTFIDATYKLNPLNNGQVKLTLSSRYQLTSKINFYGKFWGDVILSDFQGRLLNVIKKRSEDKRT
jgi:hypothetical protein